MYNNRSIVEDNGLCFSYPWIPPVEKIEGTCLGRKVQAIPLALKALVNAIDHLCLVIFETHESEEAKTVMFYASARYLEEFAGWLVTLVVDSIGQSIVHNSVTHREIYKEYVAYRKDTADRELFAKFTVKEMQRNIGNTRELDPKLVPFIPVEKFKELDFSLARESENENYIKGFDPVQLFQLLCDGNMPPAWKTLIILKGIDYWCPVREKPTVDQQWDRFYMSRVIEKCRS